MNIKINKSLKFFDFFSSSLPVNGEGGGSLVDDNFFRNKGKYGLLGQVKLCRGVGLDPARKGGRHKFGNYNV